MSFNFADVSTTGWIAVGALAALAVVLLVIARGHVRWTARMIANAALCLALAFVLSYIKLFDLPQGGAVTAASLLPIIAFAYSYGLAPGLVVGVAYGLLQMIQDPWIVSPVQAILDYPLAFACIALAAVARKLPDSWGWLAGIALGGVGRFVCHVLSGVVFLRRGHGYVAAGVLGFVQLVRVRGSGHLRGGDGVPAGAARAEKDDGAISIGNVRMGWTFPGAGGGCGPLSACRKSSPAAIFSARTAPFPSRPCGAPGRETV